MGRKKQQGNFFEYYYYVLIVFSITILSNEKKDKYLKGKEIEKKIDELLFTKIKPKKRVSNAINTHLRYLYNEKLLERTNINNKVYGYKLDYYELFSYFFKNILKWEKIEYDFYKEYLNIHITIFKEYIQNLTNLFYNKLIEVESNETNLITIYIALKEFFRLFIQVREINLIISDFNITPENIQKLKDEIKKDKEEKEKNKITENQIISYYSRKHGLTLKNVFFGFYLYLRSNIGEIKYQKVRYELNVPKIDGDFYADIKISYEELAINKLIMTLRDYQLYIIVKNKLNVEPEAFEKDLNHLPVEFKNLVRTIHRFS